jgi:hypothetical protein
MSDEKPDVELGSFAVLLVGDGSGNPGGHGALPGWLEEVGGGTRRM